MVGVLLITHGNIGAALLAGASHVLGGPQANVRALPVQPADNTASLLPRAREAVAAVDGGDGVLVFCDIYGATPSNLASCLIRPGSVEAVAGVNLPMLVRALAYRALPLGQVLARAIEAGIAGQVNIKEDACYAAAGGN